MMQQRLGLRGTSACLFLCTLPLALVAVGTLGGLGAAGVDASFAPSALGAPAGPKHQAQVDAVVKAYLGLQQQLADDKADGLGAQFAKLREAAQPLAESDDAKLKEQARTIVEHAKKAPENLKEARASFKPLSSAVIGLVKLDPATAAAAPALYEATCPMAKANWLQTSKDVANPYMGQAMRGCGSIERKLEPGGNAGGGERRSAAGAAASLPSGGSCCGPTAATANSR